MRNINPDSEENQKATRENQAAIEAEQLFALNPYRCEQCGWPISYKGTCAACIEDDNIFCNTERDEK